MAKGVKKPVIEVTDPHLILAAERAEASRERTIHRQRKYLEQQEAERAQIAMHDERAAKAKAKHDAEVGMVDVGGKLVRMK